MPLPVRLYVYTILSALGYKGKSVQGKHIGFDSQFSRESLPVSDGEEHLVTKMRLHAGCDLRIF
ncbi:hypothetical protein [uncultured Bartonella sp.]|uniref:hypothetical protein n=1 Tax=uncultured Bartonella sp. TaxID=104108 RepID=UPI0025F636F1|nr:hypothetical protein [uncultured Bartonella sp.]